MGTITKRDLAQQVAESTGTKKQTALAMADKGVDIAKARMPFVARSHK